MVPVVKPVRVTVNVNAVLPVFPSALAASAAAIARAVSSLTIVPEAAGIVIWPPPEALERVTEKPSSRSTALSPLTVTETVLLVSPAAKLTIPLGSVPPKSAASAGWEPVPVTA